MTTLPLSTDHPPGCPWPECFALRDRLAKSWHRRQGARFPLQEYQSAGNLAMANAVRTYDAATGVPFPRYLSLQLSWEMRHVSRAEAGIGNASRGRAAPQYSIELHSDQWWAQAMPSVASTAPHTAELTNVLQWLQAYPRPVMVQALWLAVQGHTEAEITATLHLTPQAINKGIEHVRKHWQAYAAGIPQARAAAEATQARDRTNAVQALRQQGQSQEAIATALGLARSTVRRVLAAAA